VTAISNFLDPSDSCADGSTFVFEGKLQDQAGTAVGSAELQSLTLSVADTNTKAIINSVSAVDILNTGRGRVDDQGNLAVTLLPADTALQDPNSSREYRSLIIDFVYNRGSSKGRHQVNIVIVALAGP
jgi:hypothetical protein